MAEHRDLTDPSIHEPKGASAASANTLWVADGAGSGSFALVGVDSLDTGSIVEVNTIIISAVLPDISTASSIYVPIPTITGIGFTLTRVDSVLGGTIATADSVITLVNSTGAVTCGTFTVAFTGSAAGDMDGVTVTTFNDFTGGTYLKITTDGASSNAIPLSLTLVFTKTVVV